VFKTPRHLPGLAGLLAVFPEACIVQTHRDPVEMLPSLCSLCEILRGAASDEVNKADIGAHWQTRLQQMFERAREVRAQARAWQILDVTYRDLMADPLRTVRGIYEFHGYEYTTEFGAAMKQWLADNRQHKHGAYRYMPEEYGLEAVEVKARFADYRREFGL